MNFDDRCFSLPPVSHSAVISEGNEATGLNQEVVFHRHLGTAAPGTSFSEPTSRLNEASPRIRAPIFGAARNQIEH